MRLADGNRPIYIFLSSPGDVAAEKNLLDDAIRDVASIFRRYGITVEAWRHERDVTPDVGSDPQAVVNAALPKDYDVYVGLMCRRFGTPTGRAGSGTIEEFQDAYSRFTHTGKPRILFYFCANPSIPSSEEQKSQLEKVSAFRQQYPGIFSSFRGKTDLLVQFQRHLVDRVLGIRFATPDLEAPISRSWVLRMAAEIDARQRSDRADQYFDYSSRRPARVLRRLEKLIDFDSTLTVKERKILTAAAYTRALRCRGGSVALLSGQLEAVLPFGSDDLANVQVVSEGKTRVPGKIRSDLLAGLLELGEMLDSDREAIADSGKIPLPQNEKLKHWLAFLTQEVAIPQRGIVRLRLLAPEGEWVDPLRRISALRIERFWERRRALFTRNGIVFAVAASEVLVSDEISPLPRTILPRIAGIAAWLQAHLGRVRHWGEHQPRSGAPDLSALLPLPDATISGPLEFQGGIEFFRRLTLRSPLKKEVVLEADEGRPLILEPAVLESGVTYRWTLDRDYGTGFPSTVGWGELRTLSERERLLRDVRAAMSSGEDRRQTQIELHLWNDLLRDLWVRLNEPDLPYEDWVLARRILYAAYQYVRQTAPGSGQVDLYRNATAWIDSVGMSQVCEEAKS